MARLFVEQLRLIKGLLSSSFALYFAEGRGGGGWLPKKKYVLFNVFSLTFWDTLHWPPLGHYIAPPMHLAIIPLKIPLHSLVVFS